MDGKVGIKTGTMLLAYYTRSMAVMLKRKHSVSRLGQNSKLNQLGHLSRNWQMYCWSIKPSQSKKYGNYYQRLAPLKSMYNVSFIGVDNKEYEPMNVNLEDMPDGMRFIGRVLPVVSAAKRMTL